MESAPISSGRRSVSLPSPRSALNPDPQVEILYNLPSVRIVAFTTSPTAVIRQSSGRGSPIVEESPGTLPWVSRSERTIAIGPLRIYRAPGSVAFLNCQNALQPILPKSQSWCVDGDSKFVLQIRRPQYWRIEVPNKDHEERVRVEELKVVLSKVLLFEKTPCPFQRHFTIELPEPPKEPAVKRPWRPVQGPQPYSAPIHEQQKLEDAPDSPRPATSNGRVTGKPIHEQKRLEDIPDSPRPATSSGQVTGQPIHELETSSGRVTGKPIPEQKNSSGRVTRKPIPEQKNSSGRVTGKSTPEQKNSSGRVTGKPIPEQKNSSGRVTGKPIPEQKNTSGRMTGKPMRIARPPAPSKSPNKPPRISVVPKATTSRRVIGKPKRNARPPTPSKSPNKPPRISVVPKSPNCLETPPHSPDFQEPTTPTRPLSPPSTVDFNNSPRPHTPATTVVQDDDSTNGSPTNSVQFDKFSSYDDETSTQFGDESSYNDIDIAAQFEDNLTYNNVETTTQFEDNPSYNVELTTQFKDEPSYNHIETAAQLEDNLTYDKAETTANFEDSPSYNNVETTTRFETDTSYDDVETTAQFEDDPSYDDIETSAQFEDEPPYDVEIAAQFEADPSYDNVETSVQFEGNPSYDDVETAGKNEDDPSYDDVETTAQFEDDPSYDDIETAAQFQDYQSFDNVETAVQIEDNQSSDNVEIAAQIEDNPAYEDVEITVQSDSPPLSQENLDSVIEIEPISEELTESNPAPKTPTFVKALFQDDGHVSDTDDESEIRTSRLQPAFHPLTSTTAPPVVSFVTSPPSKRQRSPLRILTTADSSSSHSSSVSSFHSIPSWHSPLDPQSPQSPRPSSARPAYPYPHDNIVLPKRASRVKNDSELAMPRTPGAWESSTSDDESDPKSPQMSPPQIDDNLLTKKPQVQKFLSSSKIRHRATTSSNSRRGPLSPLPAAFNLFSPPASRRPRHLQTTRHLPTAIIQKTCEILLSPPTHLLHLMINIASKIAAGEWRGVLFSGYGDVTWDFEEDYAEGPFSPTDDFGIALPRSNLPRRGSRQRPDPIEAGGSWEVD